MKYGGYDYGGDMNGVAVHGWCRRWWGNYRRDVWNDTRRISFHPWTADIHEWNAT